jgi:hypothetical protein
MYQPPVVAHAATTSTSGLPSWMHALYAVGGIFTCGFLWIVWRCTGGSRSQGASPPRRPWFSRQACIRRRSRTIRRQHNNSHLSLRRAAPPIRLADRLFMGCDLWAAAARGVVVRSSATGRLIKCPGAVTCSDGPGARSVNVSLASSPELTYAGTWSGSRDGPSTMTRADVVFGTHRVDLLGHIQVEFRAARTAGSVTRCSLTSPRPPWLASYVVQVELQVGGGGRAAPRRPCWRRPTTPVGLSYPAVTM